MSNLTKGDYVLATKYSDGDPMDHWCVGFYDGVTAPHYNPPRFDVVDSNGRNFRGNGFRRIEKITEAEGRHMLSKPYSRIDIGISIWGLLKIFRQQIG